MKVGFACCECGLKPDPSDPTPCDPGPFDPKPSYPKPCGGLPPSFDLPAYTSCGDLPFHFGASDELVECKPLENCPSPQFFRQQNPGSNNSGQRSPTENRSRHRRRTGKLPRNNTTSAQTRLQ